MEVLLMILYGEQFWRTRHHIVQRITLDMF